MSERTSDSEAKDEATPNFANFKGVVKRSAISTMSPDEAAKLASQVDAEEPAPTKEEAAPGAEKSPSADSQPVVADDKGPIAAAHPVRPRRARGRPKNAPDMRTVLSADAHAESR